MKNAAGLTLQAVPNLEARALPLKRMLDDNRTFGPKAVALLLGAFDEIVPHLFCGPTPIGRRPQKS
jgi:hypothetical protein